MDALWDSDAPRTAYELQAELDRGLASTTVLTVLGRLERKGFVTVDRGSRPHHYQPVSSRAEHMAELMHDVLRGGSTDRQAVLERFVNGVSDTDADVLRKLLTRGD
ncbi:BlaI/MecI/CopY family transcriptional regulator [Pseudoclavibacter endophyticus]|uniref:BlaI/MecI/CopY family transcriptional regulator n=2 Tax=Pseudoclavibacter endophyticus TaxID=1778590 RepID=A0A6H9WM42_9MICO|nr:BlaI/MecI/CopY family transcriptional regulator [Pseudoclavibacter endophyticus]